MTDLPSNTFPIQLGIDPDYLTNILTKDVTTLESIFELVDNAVDAARDRLLRKRNIKLDKYGLPGRYDGYQIDLKFGKGTITFVDNCSGIPENVLGKRAFIVGAMSSHPFGIGRFGIGLKRALVGLGTKYSLQTDTGKFAAKLKFTVDDLRNIDSVLYASRAESSGRPMTHIQVSGLRDSVHHEVSTSSWANDLSNHLSRRYGIYVGKGFAILVNGKPIAAFGPELRSVGQVKTQAHDLAVTKDVHVFIDSGMHENYRLTYESDYNYSKVKGLTDQYGWYFVCNDRIVEVATHERKLGWTVRWHPEYYGFVGWVRFIARDAEDLPWDTKKTTIDPHSAVFRAISDKLQNFAELYKQQIKQVRKNDIEPKGTETRAGGNSVNVSSTSSGASTAKDNTSAKPTNGKDNRPSSPSAHNQNWKTLLPALGINVKHPKLSALIYEAERLQVEMCYSASMLFRSIVEMALFEHLKTTRSLAAVRDMVYAEKEEDGREFKEDQKKKFRPNFNQALEWLNKNDDYFPSDVRRDCVYARNKFSKHLKELNGIVHEGDLTNSSKLLIARDDTMPLLVFLLEGV